jgi:hypothetical protein
MNTLSSEFLSLRVAQSDAALLEQLRQTLGGTKSDIVKQALRLMAAQQIPSTEENAPSLYQLGAPKFGRHGDAGRQSASIKSVVRARLNAKQQA